MHIFAKKSAFSKIIFSYYLNGSKLNEMFARGQGEIHYKIDKATNPKGHFIITQDGVVKGSTIQDNRDFILRRKITDGVVYSGTLPICKNIPT